MRNNNIKPPNCKCDYCGVRFRKKPSSVKEYNYCGQDCKNKGLHLRQVEMLERKIGIDDLKSWLEHKYIDDRLNLKEISLLMYGTRTNSPNVGTWIEKMGIPKRTRSDAVAMQWEHNDERRRNQAQFIKKKMGPETESRKN